MEPGIPELQCLSPSCEPCQPGGNSVLIYGSFGFPAMGITGSAISTVTAQWIGAALALMATMGRNYP